MVYVHRGMHRVQWKGKGKKKKKQVDDGRVDLYALLGLQNERYLATDADIKNGESHHSNSHCAHISGSTTTWLMTMRCKQPTEDCSTIHNHTQRIVAWPWNCILTSVQWEPRMMRTVRPLRHGSSSFRRLMKR